MTSGPLLVSDCVWCVNKPRNLDRVCRLFGRCFTCFLGDLAESSFPPAGALTAERNWKNMQDEKHTRRERERDREKFMFFQRLIKQMHHSGSLFSKNGYKCNKCSLVLSLGSWWMTCNEEHQCVRVESLHVFSSRSEMLEVKLAIIL